MRARALTVAIACALTVAFLPVSTATAGDAKQKTIKLFGEIDEFSYLTSSAGVKLSSRALPAKVAKISLGSAAAYSGLREGDKVLSVDTKGDQLIFSIDRNGKRYEASVATDVTGLKTEFEKRKVKWSLGEAAFDKEIAKLTNCNVVILLDRSKSMEDNHAGVPGDQSKWSWCRQQIDNFYFSTSKFFEHGFDIVTFGPTTTRWKNVSLWDMKMVFGRFKPEGDRKDIASPLNSILTDYLHERKPDSKPLVVVVLTDGMKNEGRPLQQVLAEASQQMKYEHEITVIFMPVGDSIFADELFNDLDRNMQAKGAPYDIAEYKPFAELRNKGVLWTLLATYKDIESSGATANKR